MFSSAELIEALRRRMRRSLRPPAPPGEFPPAWQEWFALMAARPGRVVGATAGEMLAAAGARAPAIGPGNASSPAAWRAFSIRWREDPRPPGRDERWLRIAATSASLLLHLVLVVGLAWLMFTRFWFLAPEEAAREGEEHVLQVEYIGEGTPEDVGGGASPAPVESPDAPAPAAASTQAREEVDVPSPVPSPPGAVPPEAGPDPEPQLADAAPEPLPVLAQPEVVLEAPALAMPPVPVRDVLQVTEVDVPDSRFVVPPPREAVIEAPSAEVPEVAVRSREIDVQAQPETAVPATRAPREVDVSAPPVVARGVEVVEREIEVVEPGSGAARLRTRDPVAIDAPAISPRGPDVRQRDVPMPTPGTVTLQASDPGSGQAPARPAPGAGRGATPADAPPGGRPEATAGTRGTGVAPGAGPRTGQPPGALPSSSAGDDWGDSSRNVPGRQAGVPGSSGLFNADGSPRLADGGRVGGGLPPGTVMEDFENVDRHGTWMKRPGYDHDPTAFDEFWLPSESLLEEWVRKSVTEVRIPIPGTTKSIRCVTVMLALGGACSVHDPNLQEQATHGRPAPEIPFKRELQEDQESLGPPPAE